MYISPIQVLPTFQRSGLLWRMPLVCGTSPCNHSRPRIALAHLSWRASPPDSLQRSNKCSIISLAGSASFLNGRNLYIGNRKSVHICMMKVLSGVVQKLHESIPSQRSRSESTGDLPLVRVSHVMVWWSCCGLDKSNYLHLIGLKIRAFAFQQCGIS